jgi:monoamine oxidase
MLDIAIIGAGLSGLSLADRLLEDNRHIAVFEARNRYGGRILSRSVASGSTASAFAVDLGPTWVWPDHQPRIAALAERLGLAFFRQWDSGHSLYQIDARSAPTRYIDTRTHDSARRIKGGCQQLIAGLLQRLPDSILHPQHRLLQLADRDSCIDLAFDTGNGQVSFRAKQVVLALPPRLVAENITFEPALAPKLIRAMQDIPTWMAGHAKAMLVYPEAFWRRQGYSGNALQPYPGAVLAEIYDACSERGDSAALFGFFGLPAFTRELYRGNLEALIVQQMAPLFGAAAANPLQVLVQDWSAEPFTATEQDRTPPTDHPRYGHPWLQLDHWQDKLYFCGTETAEAEGGYLEGALEASDRVFTALTL